MAAAGEYILFLDSDDWISADVLEACISEIIDNDYPDIIVYQLYNTLTKECLKNNVPDGYYGSEKINSEIIDSLLMNENGFSAFPKSLSGKVFKREVILNNQLSIPYEVRIAEDAAAFVSAVMDSKSISVNSSVRYYCFVRDGSVSHSSDKDAFERLPYLFAYYKEKMRNCSIDISRQFERYIVSQLYTSALMTLRSGESIKKINADLNAVLKDDDVSSALKKAEFNRKGYKFLIKKFIIRYRLWGIAKLLDRINI